MPGLVLAGFALVGIPLAVAVGFGVIFVDELTSRSERLVQQGVQVTRYSKRLANEITAMERNARQYAVLGNEELIERYAMRQTEFKGILLALEDLRLQGVADWNLEQMRADSQAILQAMRDYAPDSVLLETEFSRFAQMNELAVGIANQGNQFIDSELEGLERTSKQARLFMLSSLTLAPVALALVALFTYLISRPIRQINRSIERLGSGRFDQPIEVNGPPQELKALGDRLDWLRRRLEELERDKNEFMRNMSHELKTPLASIREGAELLLDGSVGGLTDAQREVANILEGSSLELQYLIENLLNIGANQEKLATPAPRHVDLAKLLRSALARFRLGIATRRLKVEIDSEGIQVYADRAQLSIALSNLISNAIKFSPIGGTIVIKARRKPGEVIIDVADMGPGIPAKDKERIFEPFFQAHTPEGRHMQGTGIGLSVVRHCVQAHGGSVAVIEGEYPGAHIRMTLPEQQESHASAA